MTADPRAAALAAYHRFFEGWNSREAERWADALNFPHVRVSGRGPVAVVGTRAEHVREMNWDAVRASGWVRSEAAAPEVLHVSPDVVHVRGGWTRFDAAGQAILRNEVTYVITRMQENGAEHWGMQGRFGIDPGADSAPGSSYAANGERAVAVVGEYLDAWNARDYARCAALMNYPAAQVLPGEIRFFPDAEAFAGRLSKAGWLPIVERRLAAIQCGPNAVNVAIDMRLEREEQAIFLVTERDGHWGIQGRSIIEH